MTFDKVIILLIFPEVTADLFSSNVVRIMTTQNDEIPLYTTQQQQQVSLGDIATMMAALFVGEATCSPVRVEGGGIDRQDIVCPCQMHVLTVRMVVEERIPWLKMSERNCEVE
jgi:hypothetical protein